MREIAATEAKAHLSELLRQVEQGEAIAITRHGRTVAHLMPPAVHDQESRKAAVEEFLKHRATLPRLGVTRDELLAWRHEGHRL